jgi:hypothetical protein
LVIVCLAGAAPAAEVQADPKSLSKALESAQAGDTILLATGEYPAVAISKTYEKPLTIAAAKGAKPVMTAGVSVTKASRNNNLKN